MLLPLSRIPELSPNRQAFPLIKEFLSRPDLVPSCSTREYGRAYMEVQATYQNFFNLDPDQFTPAEVLLCNLNSGRSFQAGTLRPDILRRSFGLEIVSEK